MRHLTLLSLLAAIASAEPTVFEARLDVGETVVVTEEQRIEGKIRYEAVKGKSKEEFGKRKADFLEIKRFQYDQDTQLVKGEESVRERMFALATKEEIEEDGKTRRKSQFPHHQRKVKVAKGKEGTGVYIEGEQAEDGIQEQGWMDTLPLLLPKEPLAEGKEYEVDGAAVMRSWSRGAFSEKSTSGTGKGKFQEHVTHDRKKCAKLWVSVPMKGEGKDLPTIEMSVSGTLLYQLETGKIVKADLSGPVIYRTRVKEAKDVGDVDMTVTGTIKVTFTAEGFPSK